MTFVESSTKAYQISNIFGVFLVAEDPDLSGCSLIVFVFVSRVTSLSEFSMGVFFKSVF